MKGYFSVDIETLGLDPEMQKLFEVSAIYQVPGNLCSLPELKRQGRVFSCFVEITEEDVASSDIVAYQLNKERIDRVVSKNVKSQPLFRQDEIFTKLEEWMRSFEPEGKTVVAGKNFGVFDYQFIKRLPNFNDKLMSHRFIDPAMFFLDFNESVCPPALSECLEKAGLNSHVSHCALEDAYQVVQLLESA